MTAVCMLEEIEDAVFLHQPRDKVKGRFPVLDDVFALRITSLGSVLKVLKTVILKNLLDDFGDSFLLEDLAIGSAGKKPKPGNNFRAVVSEAIVALETRKLADNTIPKTFSIREQHGNRDRLSDDGLVLHIVVFRKKVRGKVK